MVWNIVVALYHDTMGTDPSSAMAKTTQIIKVRPDEYEGKSAQIITDFFVHATLSQRDTLSSTLSQRETLSSTLSQRHYWHKIAILFL